MATKPNHGSTGETEAKAKADRIQGKTHRFGEVIISVAANTTELADIGRRALVAHAPGLNSLTVSVKEGDSARSEFLESLASQLPSWRRLLSKPGLGGVEVRLDRADGEQVKTGAVFLTQGDTTISIPIDPFTRRFRVGDLEPGSYVLEARSSNGGSGVSKIEIRENDITRHSVTLDGTEITEVGSVQLSLAGATSATLKVNAIDRATGAVVFAGPVRFVDGKAKIDRIPAGHIHFDVEDDAGAKSCYDTDVIGRIPRLDLIDIQIEFPPFDPGGPIERGPIIGLPREFDGLIKILPQLGVNSIQELAQIEAEDLMHKIRNSKLNLTIPNPRIGNLVDAARSRVGLSKVSGLQFDDIQLGPQQTMSRKLLPEAAGPVRFRLEGPPEHEFELVVTTGSGTERRRLRGSEEFEILVATADLTGKPIDVTVINHAEVVQSAKLTTQLPSMLGAIALLPKPSTLSLIESLLASLSSGIPGLTTKVNAARLDSGNIQGYIDRARAFLQAAGVCSIDDLGDLRVNPLGVLRPGFYLATKKKTAGKPPSLKHYAFSVALADNVLKYLPNDVLHKTAIVAAEDWDITGQSIELGSEVEELVVIAKRIKFNNDSVITWEQPGQPSPRTYYPFKAERGVNGSREGADGGSGSPGNEDPHQARNGGIDGADAPLLTLYVLDTTGGLPRIKLIGQSGGPGGRGQEGGDGGDGARGWDSDSGFFCCIREVGWGGKGGDGGRGGKGGAGGRGGGGGRVTLLTSDASIAALAEHVPVLEIGPGQGGDGGPAGKGGNGGNGGGAGSADCSVFCASHDDRVGSRGTNGTDGDPGRHGDPGPNPREDTLLIFPMTAEQWNTQLNNPHILSVNPLEAEPEENVTVMGDHFQVTDALFFDGKPVPDARFVDDSSMSFNIPADAEPGLHPIVIRPLGSSSRRSNKVMLKVIPKLINDVGGDRWVDGSSHQLHGAAFADGCEVFIEDRSVTPFATFNLPITARTRTTIDITVPNPMPQAMRGVKRLVVRNPDGGKSRAEVVVRLSDTIVVKVAAFRVVGMTPGIGTPRTDAEIAALFDLDNPNSVSAAWSGARVAFEMVQAVQTVTIADTNANLWPSSSVADEQTFATNNGAIRGAINLYFFGAVEQGTAHARFGGGPVMYGEEEEGHTPPLTLEPRLLRMVIAHELGHTLCLAHVCSAGIQAPATTLFGRNCIRPQDNHFLMLPWYDVATGFDFANFGGTDEVTVARQAATRFERGKTDLPAINLSAGTPGASANCAVGGDADN